MTSVFRLWHSGSMGMRTYTILLAWRLLWPRRSCQRLVAGICVLGIALGLMLQIVVRGVMDGMVREIDAGTRFCMPDLLVTNWPYETGQALRVPGVCSATACQAGMGTGPHGLCRYSTWYEPEQLAPLLADGGLGQALISRSYAEKSGLRAGDYLLMQLPGHQHRLEVSGIFRVPGRMLAPDILLPHPIQGGTPALALHLTPGADENLCIHKLREIAPESAVHPAQSDTRAWLGIIGRAKQTMGFILYLCTALAAFACGALLWVLCLQRRQELSIMAAYGMPPSQQAVVILCMATAVAAGGIALGLPLAWATLHWREPIRQLLAELGVQAFPVEVLDMSLPALTTPGLYLTHAFFTFAMVFLSSVPALRLILRISSHAPQQ